MDVPSIADGVRKGRRVDEDEESNGELSGEVITRLFMMP